MKSVNRWENTFLRRLTVVAAIPFMVVLIVIVGALLGIKDAALDIGGAMCGAWRGSGQ